MNRDNRDETRNNQEKNNGTEGKIYPGINAMVTFGCQTNLAVNLVGRLDNVWLNI
jgi:hypothetical protein